MGLEYKPLDFSKFETRILQIMPLDKEVSTNEALVHCRLRTISLISPPKFNALSYCWGDPEVTTPVMIDKQIVRVTTSLNDALRELRWRKVRTIWADAICINQDDLYEKSQQVLQMGNVYARASKVYAWLGASSPGSDEAIEALESRHPVDISPDIMQSIFQRPFWRRVWIIQEMAKAREVEFMIGEKRFTWDDAASLLSKAVYRELLSADQLELLAYLHDFRTREQSGQAMPLALALAQSKSSVASDFRDKIYGLLGLVSDGARIVPMPNYSQSPAEVLDQTVYRILTEQKRLSILLLARRCGDTVQNEFPSWYPNLLSLAHDLPPWILESTGMDLAARHVTV